MNLHNAIKCSLCHPSRVSTLSKRKHAKARVGRHVRAVVCQFVGERGSNATEYHDNDFDWMLECVADGEVAVARQRQEHKAKATDWCEGENPVSPQARTQYSSKWEEFHYNHSAGRFFKEKRYLTIAFPRLLEEDPSQSGVAHKIGEIGCGCGSALIPVLRENKSARAKACDVSETAIKVFDSMCSKAGIDRQRLDLFVHAAGSAVNDTSQFNPNELDTMMIIFTLSAFHPKEMAAVLKEAWTALKPGGMILFRDYGMYDMAHLRFTGEQLVDPDALVYQRADGTLSHFFSTENAQHIFQQAGFSCIDCRYVTTYVTNKKKNTKMRRVYIHGVFQKTNDYYDY
jgi:methyltransferase-like protein 6